MFKHTIIVVHIIAINNALWTNATEDKIGDIDEDVIVKLIDRVDKLEAREEGHLREIEALRDEVKQLKDRVGEFELLINPLPLNDTNSDCSNLKASADDKIKCEKYWIWLSCKSENIEAKEENADYQHFLLLSRFFPKPVLKGRQNQVLFGKVLIGDIDEDVIVKLIDRMDKLEAREEGHLREIVALRDEVKQLKGQVEPKIRQRRQDVADNVAFYAVVDTHHIRNLGANQRIEFDRVVTNIGGGYLPGLGVFITPVGGTYVFTTTLMGVNHNNVQYYVSVNGNAVGNLYIHGEDSYLDSASRTVVLYLNKGDEISVNNSNVTEGVFGYQFSSFAGFLLRPDVSISDIVG